MPSARRTQISLDETPYYHCISRCVRRAFLCGLDVASNQSYEHRRQWVEDRLHAISGIFAIELCAYAVMSNHYHVVVRVNVDQASNWNKDEVIRRWHQLFRGTVQSRRYVTGASMSKGEQYALDTSVSIWRQRLMDISWFMRVINESIARRANEEDQCSGRFWEGRFKCQALLDEAALVSCMAYVDLNPIRSGIADTPETAAHTSIKLRCDCAVTAFSPNHPNQQPGGLVPFTSSLRQETPGGLPLRLTDYLELVDWTGRILRDDKYGSITGNQPAILNRLRLGSDQWLYLTQHFESRFKNLVGRAYTLKATCRRLGYQRIPGLGASLYYLTSG